MSEDSMDNDKVNKIFSEMIKSTDMEEVTKEVEKQTAYDIKQLILLQEVLGDCVSNVSQIIFMILNSEPPVDEDIPEILNVLYKSAEDFNNSMVELYIDLEDDIGEEDE